MRSVVLFSPKNFKKKKLKILEGFKIPSFFCHTQTHLSKRKSYILQKNNALDRRTEDVVNNHVRGANSPGFHPEEGFGVHQRFGDGRELRVHDEWIRVASDGFVARLPGGADAEEHGLRPLPVRPRRHDGNELVEHGALILLLLLLRLWSFADVASRRSTKRRMYVCMYWGDDFQNREYQRAKSREEDSKR